MSSARSEELRLTSEQAFESLDQPAATPEEREGQLNWLMESALHVREVLAATQWDEELRRLLDPDHRIDAEALVAKALGSNAVSVAGGETTDAPVSEHLIDSQEEGILDLGDATHETRLLDRLRSRSMIRP